MGAPRKKPWARKRKVGVTIRADILDAAQANADTDGISLSQYIEDQLVRVAAPKKGRIKD